MAECDESTRRWPLVGRNDRVRSIESVMERVCEVLECDV